MTPLRQRMLERWTQENLFRYMRQHFALDALLTCAVEPAGPARTVPNPARKALAKTLATTRATLTDLEHTDGQRARRNAEQQRPTMRRFTIANAAMGQQITALETEVQTLKARIADLPKRVPITAVLDEAAIVRLAPEAKHLTDTIKMVAYRAETALVRHLAPHNALTEDDGRALIRKVLLASADIVPDGQQLRVRAHALANPRSNAALTHLCDTLNALGVRYPGTDLTLVYQAPGGA